MTTKERYEMNVCVEIQELIQLRIKTKMSQQNLADKLEVSIKTVQRFENYRSKSGYLIFGYKVILKK